MNKRIARLLQAPSVVLLLIWMLVPLCMTIYFSFMRYNLLQLEPIEFDGWTNYEFFITDPSFWPALSNTLILVGSVLIITVVLGLALALLINRPFFGRGIVRVLMISPFFIMPTVNAVIWENMLMNPIYGIFSFISTSLGLEPVRWLESYPLMSIIMMVSWQWTPFALLIFITSLTKGGPGDASTNLAYLIFIQGFIGNDIGIASAGGVFAIILANIVAFFLLRAIGKTLMV